MQSFVWELLDFLSLTPNQVALNGWRTIIASMVIGRECSGGVDNIIVEEFLYYFEPSQIAASPSFWMFKNRDQEVELIAGHPCPTRNGRTGIFLYVVTTGKSFLGRKWMKALSECVRSGERPRHLVCVYVCVCVCVCVFVFCS